MMEEIRKRRLAYHKSEFYKEPRTELEVANFDLNIENILNEEMKHLCPECAEPSLNDGKGPFCCGTCKDYRCDKCEKGSVIASNGHMVCTSCGTVGDPVFVREVVIRDEDGNKITAKPARRKKTEYKRQDYGGQTSRLKHQGE